MGFNAVWFSPFFETTQRETVNAQGETVSHSLYATRDHAALDPEFSATKIFSSRDSLSAKERADIDAKDRAHLEHFTQQAQKQGMRVMAMADLVFNHVAADHWAVLEENKKVSDFLTLAKAQGHGVSPVYAADGKTVIGMKSEGEAMLFAFERDEKTFTPLNIGHTIGYDTAQINYASPAAREFFVSGRNGVEGYWKQVIDWCMDRGLKDFRCDIAYRVPPDWWQELITYARARNEDAVFMAETLGGPDDAVDRMARIRVKDAAGAERPAFDLGMASNYWWNFTDDWFTDAEAPRLERMAKFGAAASPDNHDTPETLSGHFSKVFSARADKDDVVAAICLRNYAAAAFTGNAVYMQMGYEYCKEKQNGVFKGDTTPQDFIDVKAARAGGKSALDISQGIAQINALKEKLGIENCRVRFTAHGEEQGGRIVRLAMDYVDADTGAKKASVTLLLNKKPENGAVALAQSTLDALEKSGMQGTQENESVQSFALYHTPVAPPAPFAQKQVVSKQARPKPPAA